MISPEQLDKYISELQVYDVLQIRDFDDETDQWKWMDYATLRTRDDFVIAIYKVKEPEETARFRIVRPGIGAHIILTGAA